MKSNLEAFELFKGTLPKEVSLIAVSKTNPADVIKELYDAGHRDFGENKVQEVCEKYEHLPKDIQWHFIGHLQRNKVKYIAPFVALIHSVDSERLLVEINKRGEQNDRIIPCLLQLHIAREEHKFGLDQEELSIIIDKVRSGDFPYVRVKGLMGMASNTNDVKKIKVEFQGLKKLYDHYRRSYNDGETTFNTLSMGMTGDYQIAIEAGSNMLRIGSLIFGSRQ
ncbi:MAG: YggS family pyridoxal phosphate-dependent enzyme [Vicingaceae bacterium]